MKLSRLFYPIAGILLMPVVIGAFHALWHLVQSAFGNFPDVTLSFAGGIISYLLLQWFFRKPMLLYVFGHELTHAIAGFFSGARIHSFSILEGSGKVALSKTNIFVVLAPYCLPLYTLLIILTYKIWGLYQDISGYWPLCMFFVGASWAFHVALTAHAIKLGQPDMKYVGTILSGVLIVLANCFMLALLLKFLYPDRVRIFLFLRDVLVGTFGVWKWIVSGVLRIGRGGNRTHMEQAP